MTNMTQTMLTIALTLAVTVLLVDRIIPGSIAALEGTLRQGDIIISVQGTPCSTVGSLTDILRRAPATVMPTT